MTRAFLRARTSTSPSAIINTSTEDSFNTIPTFSAYATSKAAVNILREFVSSENKDRGVQCIAFHSGGIPDTDITRSGPPEWMKPYFTDAGPSRTRPSSRSC